MTETADHVRQLLATVTKHAERARADLEDGDAYEALAALETALTTLTDARNRTVRLWHQRGASWTDVGALYETTRQAAWQRFADPREPEPPADPDPPLSRQQRRALERRGGGS